MLTLSAHVVGWARRVGRCMAANEETSEDAVETGPDMPPLHLGKLSVTTVAALQKTFASDPHPDKRAFAPSKSSSASTLPDALAMLAERAHVSVAAVAYWFVTRRGDDDPTVDELEACLIGGVTHQVVRALGRRRRRCRFPPC